MDYTLPNKAIAFFLNLIRSLFILNNNIILAVLHFVPYLLENCCICFYRNFISNTKIKISPTSLKKSGISSFQLGLPKLFNCTQYHSNCTSDRPDTTIKPTESSLRSGWRIPSRMAAFKAVSIFNSSANALSQLC